MDLNQRSDCSQRLHPFCGDKACPFSSTSCFPHLSVYIVILQDHIHMYALTLIDMIHLAFHRWFSCLCISDSLSQVALVTSSNLKTASPPYLICLQFAMKKLSPDMKKDKEIQFTQNTDPDFN